MFSVLLSVILPWKRQNCVGVVAKVFASIGSFLLKSVTGASAVSGSHEIPNNRWRLQ